MKRSSLQLAGFVYEFNGDRRDKQGV